MLEKAICPAADAATAAPDLAALVHTMLLLLPLLILILLLLLLPLLMRWFRGAC